MLCRCGHQELQHIEGVCQVCKCQLFMHPTKIKMWAGSRTTIGLAAEHLNRWAEDLDCLDITEVDKLVKELISIRDRLRMIDASAISMQIAPNEL